MRLREVFRSTVTRVLVAAALTLVAATILHGQKVALLGTTIPTQAGNVVVTVCPTGCTYNTIQAAIDAAQAGWVIKARQNVTFLECVVLRNKGVLSDYITLTTDADPSLLPAIGVRTDPSYAALMPKIQSVNCGSTPTITTENGANHYRIRHVEFPTVKSGGVNGTVGWNAIVQIGWSTSQQQKRADEPTDIVIDRNYIHGDPVGGQKRGIESHGERIVVDSNVLLDIKSINGSQDSQGISGLNGFGPLTVTNNEISAGTEPFLLGGGDPTLRVFWTFTGTPTSTSGTISLSEAGHTFSELSDWVNHGISIAVGGHHQFTTLRSASQSTSTTGTITYDALTAAADQPGGGRAEVTLGMLGPGTGLTFERNWVHNQLAWQTGILAAPANAAAQIGGTGTLPSGQKCYTVQTKNTGGYQGATEYSPQSNETCATLAASGRIQTSWNAAVATSYLVWRGTTPGGENQFVETTNLSIVDDGSLTWTNSSVTAATVVWIKNLFELKAAQNVQVDSNVFEYAWRTDAGNNGTNGAWIKTANQGDGTAGITHGLGTALQTRDVVIEKNIWRHIYGWMLLHGEEAPSGFGYDLPGPLTNFTVRNNWVYDSGGSPWNLNPGTADGWAFQPTNGINSWTLDHNTVDHVTSDDQANGGGGLLQLDSTQLLFTNFVVTNNMLRRETYGIFNAGGHQGTAALNDIAPGPSWTFLDNAVAEASGGSYPASNFYDTLATWKAQFVNYAGGDYHIQATSTYHNAGTDGKDLGADIDAVTSATSGVAAIPRTILTQTDLTLVGAYAVPQVVNGLNTYAFLPSYQQGYALRYCSGTLHAFVTGWASGQVQNQVIELVVPILKTTAYNQAAVFKNWGNIYGTERVDVDNSGISQHGIYSDEPNDPGALYWFYSQTYSNSQGSGIGRSRLRCTDTSATAEGSWSLSGLGQKVADSGGTLIPATFATTYLSGKRLAVGFGGNRSVNCCGLSMGPTLVAIDPPSQADHTALPNVPLMYFDKGAMCCGGHRELRPPNIGGLTMVPSNGIDDWDGAHWTWQDGDVGDMKAVWIDTGKRRGVVYIAGMSSGKMAYVNATTAADIQRHYALVYDPNDFIDVIQGRKTPLQMTWNNAFELQFGQANTPKDFDYTKWPFTVPTATLTSLTKIDATHIQVTWPNHGIASQEIVGITGASQAEFNTFYTVSAVVDANTLTLVDVYANFVSSGASPAGTGYHMVNGGNYGRMISGVAYDATVKQLHIAVMDAAYNGGTQLVYVYQLP